MNNAHTIIWGAELDNLIIAWTLDGMTARAIAKELSDRYNIICTRNAVLGRRFRLKHANKA